MNVEDPAARAAAEAERMLPCSLEPYIYICGSIGHHDICPGKYRAEVAAALLEAERRGAEQEREKLAYEFGLRADVVKEVVRKRE